MAHHNEDSLSASFESKSIGTQYNDSSNDDNIFLPNTMSYGSLLQILRLSLMKNME